MTDEIYNSDNFNNEVYYKIYKAIVQQRITPGTRLIEKDLADLFDVGRSKVREAIKHLSAMGLVKIIPNKGALINYPSYQEIIDIFEGRIMIECSAIIKLFELPYLSKKRMISTLLKISEAEVNAIKRNEISTALGLSGEFHIYMVYSADNRFLFKSIEFLVPQTCIAILSSGSNITCCCLNKDHERIIESLENGSPNEAVEIVKEHFESLKKNVLDELGRKGKNHQDLNKEIFNKISNNS